MLFVNAFYLAAIAGIAGPILMHLLLRQRPQRQVLPTLRFLNASAPQSYSMHRLKNLLLLISRVLLILLIALAFARPFIDEALASQGEETADLGLVLVLDTSFSMRSGDTWDQAITLAKNTLKALPDQSPVALVTFDKNPHVAVTETRDIGRVNAELRVLQPGYYSTDLGAAFRAGGEAANQLNARRVRVVVISDFQRSAVPQAMAPVSVRVGIEFEPAQVGAEPEANVYIASNQVIPNEAEKKRSIVLEIRRFGEYEDASEVELLEDGKSLGTQEVQLIGAQSFVEFKVDEPQTDDTTLEAIIRSSDTPEEDNRHTILVESRQPIPVLILQQTGRIQLASDATEIKPVGVNRFMEAMIASCSDLIDATWFDGARISIEELSRYPVVLAMNVDAYGVEALSAIKTYVESGGALIMFPGRGEMSAFQSLTGSESGGWNRLDRESSEYRLVSTTRLQGPMDMLGNTGESVLGHPKVYEYLQLATNADEDTEIVAQLDDGSPFLLERRAGDGLIFAFTIALSTESTDFVLRASFAPFLYELMAHATRETRARQRYAVGDGVPAPLTRGVHTVVSPNGKKVPAEEMNDFGVPGTYTFESDHATTLVTANIDPAESDLTRLNRAEINAMHKLAFVGEAGSSSNSTAGMQITLPPDDDSKIWRIFLITALCLLAFESLLGSRTIR